MTRPGASPILWERYRDALHAFMAEPRDDYARAVVESFQAWAPDFIGDATAARRLTAELAWKLRLAGRRAA